MTQFTRFLYVILITLTITPLMGQSADELAESIANTYCDSLTNYIPPTYDASAYPQIERFWIRKIVMLKKQEISEYLKLRGQLQPKDGYFEEEVFYEIVQKAMKGCPFYLALYGKGVKAEDIKPSLKELLEETCKCIEAQTTSMTPRDIVETKKEESGTIMMECLQQNFPPFREQIFEDYKLGDKESFLHYGNVSAGHLFTTCPKLIASNGSEIAAAWATQANTHIVRGYNQSAWNVAHALEKPINDSIANYFNDVNEYQKALPSLQQFGKLMRESPGAFVLGKGRDQNITQEIFTLTWVYKQKVLFQMKAEYESSPYGKLKNIIFLDRNNIQDIAELDKEYAKIPPPPPPPPFPPKQ